MRAHDILYALGITMIRSEESLEKGEGVFVRDMVLFDNGFAELPCLFCWRMDRAIGKLERSRRRSLRGGGEGVKLRS